jgi:hypothetical protein
MSQKATVYYIYFDCEGMDDYPFIWNKDKLKMATKIGKKIRSIKFGDFLRHSGV